MTSSAADPAADAAKTPAQNPAEAPAAGAAAPKPQPSAGLPADAIRSARFRAEREPGWRRLEALLNTVERGGARALSYDQALELASLYRQAINSLSVARAISMDKALLAYLDALCARAYLAVYAPQESLGGLLGRLLVFGIPQAVRRCAPALIIGFLAMLLGGVLGWVLISQDQSWFYSFVPPGLADGRTPEASAEYLRSTLFDDGANDRDNLSSFASFLFSHNTQVAILTFAMGIFFCAPSFALTFYNGLILGGFLWMFADKGLGYEAAGWLSIHGVTEIAAFCFACAGGAQLGLAMLLPGQQSRRAALRDRGRDAVKLMLLSGLMLIVAALIEGFLRQMITSTPLRLGIGWGLGLFWLLWLTLSGHERRPAARSGREARA